jgi:hypothetical protein
MARRTFPRPCVLYAPTRLHRYSFASRGYLQ